MTRVTFFAFTSQSFANRLRQKTVWISEPRPTTSSALTLRRVLCTKNTNLMFKQWRWPQSGEWLQSLKQALEWVGESEDFGKFEIGNRKIWFFENYLWVWIIFGRWSLVWMTFEENSNLEDFGRHLDKVWKHLNERQRLLNIKEHL